MPDTDALKENTRYSVYGRKDLNSDSALAARTACVGCRYLRKKYICSYVTNWRLVQGITKEDQIQKIKIEYLISEFMPIAGILLKSQDFNIFSVQFLS